MKNLICCTTIGALVVLLGTSSVRAAIADYNGNLAGWQAAVVEHANSPETFLGDTANYAAAAKDVGDFTVSKGAGGTDAVHQIANFGLTYPAPSLGIRTGTSETAATTILTFDFPIVAFGFDGEDVDAGGTDSMSTNNGDTLFLPSAGTGWYGFTSSTPFTVVTFDGPNDAWYADNIRYATTLQQADAVPEPSTYLLGLIGLVGLGWVALRARRSIC
jgi:hypothetical protein